LRAETVRPDAIDVTLDKERLDLAIELVSNILRFNNTALVIPIQLVQKYNAKGYLKVGRNSFSSFIYPFFSLSAM
jgi:hypothetical protein